jgi:hypothetical protein
VDIFWLQFRVSFDAPFAKESKSVGAEDISPGVNPKGICHLTRLQVL